MSIYLPLVILIIIAFILKMPKVKGLIGEGAAKLVLKKLNPNEYFVLNDIMISNDSGKTSQIDHVVVSEYGIFVIETKNYQGWITGSENSQYWTQTIYKRKEKLYNPVWQNSGHVKTLKELLVEFGEIKFIPIVAFSGRATLKVNVNAEVIYVGNLAKVIKKYNSKVISPASIQKIVQKLSSSNKVDKEAREAHVRSIKENISEQNVKVKNNICPSCGDQLIQRTGQFGKFIGCSNYPKCKYIIKNVSTK